MFDYQYYIYLMMNKRNTVIYVGMTNNLLGRVIQHKAQIHPKSFTARYNVNKLVYYEVFEDVWQAINREKEIKGWVRSKKLVLIRLVNPMFRDLYNELYR